MNTTKSILTLVFMLCALFAKAQVATDVVAKLKNVEGINHQEITAFVNEARNRFDAISKENAPASLPPGLPSAAQFRDFFASIKTISLLHADTPQARQAVDGVLKGLDGYVSLIIYDDIEQPTYEDGPDNVRRLKLPQGFKVEGMTNQAYGRVDDKNNISDLIICVGFQQHLMLTCVTGSVKIENLQMFYGMERMIQYASQQHHRRTE